MGNFVIFSDIFIGHHTGDRLRGVADELLLEFFDEKTLVSSVVTDSGGNYRSLSHALSGSGFFIANFFKVYMFFEGSDAWGCVAHLLNLCVHDALAQSNDVKKLVDEVIPNKD
jgi:hypothetical protein